MTWAVKPRIFNWFGTHDKVSDSYKDINGKGLYQRFVEALAGDFDDTVKPWIEDGWKSTKDPMLCRPAYTRIKAEDKAIELVMGGNVDAERQVLRSIHQYNKIRGTRRAYDLMLRQLGFTTITIDVIQTRYSFDSSVTFDSPNRRLDSSCNKCFEYTVDVSGSVVMTPSLVKSVISVVAYNEPVNATLKGLTVNGSGTLIVFISVSIDEDTGDLIFFNDLDPSLQLYLNSNGDLIVDGPNASKYSIVDGYLMYTV